MRTEQQRLEAFGKPNPETGELVVDRGMLLKSYVEKGLYILKEIDMLKSDTKQLLDEAESDSIDKSELKTLIKYAYKDTLSAEIEKLEEVQAKLNNMFG